MKKSKRYLAPIEGKAIPPEVKVKVDKFWADWEQDTRKLLDCVLELEKAAVREGYILAVGLVSGCCQLCEKCNVERGVCVHPELKRYSEEGVGVNVKATAENAGIKFTLPFEGNPETFALLLID